MNLAQHYDELYRASLPQIRRNNFTVDHFIDDPSDTRLGLTLLLRLAPSLVQEVQHFLDQLRAIDANQYYYHEHNLHLTILSIISCYAGFDPQRIDFHEYVQTIQPCLERCSPFKINFRGLSCSPSAILLQGFPENEELTTLRDCLRSTFRRSSLESSIDKRYTLSTAHVTLVRFKQPVQQLSTYLELIEHYRSAVFGTASIGQVELVINDWYHQPQKVRLIKKIEL